MERPGEWVTLADARQRLLAVLRRADPTEMPIRKASGRVLARDVVAPRDVPPFPASGMDGYAFGSVDVSDGPTTLEVVGSVGAGRPVDLQVGTGEAVAIATGGAVPRGADTVSPIEEVEVVGDGDQVVVPGPVDQGAYVRPAGSDTAAGDPVFGAGTRLGPAHLGVLATLGLATVLVHGPVRVGVLATGDELVEPPDVPGPGQIYDANRPTLAAAGAELGCDVIDLGMVADDPATLDAVLGDAAGRCDVILTSGGVSVGEADHLKDTLGRLAPGATTWLEVRMRPGKPFGFAVLESSGVPVLCLPGNPVSALVSFEVLVRPALDWLAGGTGTTRRVQTFPAAEDFARESDGKIHFVRAVVRRESDGAWSVRSAGGQSSHQLRVLAGANALAIIDDGEVVAAGDPVRVLVLDDSELRDPGEQP